MLAKYYGNQGYGINAGSLAAGIRIKNNYLGGNGLVSIRVDSDDVTPCGSVDQKNACNADSRCTWADGE
jgi:hypothetical protein